MKDIGYDAVEKGERERERIRRIERIVERGDREKRDIEMRRKTGMV